MKLLRGPDWRWALLFGAALGVGMLAKYAMAYFLAGIVITALFDRASRDVLLRRQTWAALALALVILSPNVLWNMLNGFVTLKHTGDNIQGSGLKLSPLGALEFVATQFGVAGPLLFGGLLVALAGFRKAASDARGPADAGVRAAAAGRDRGARTSSATSTPTGRRRRSSSATIVVVAIWLREGRTARCLA